MTATAEIRPAGRVGRPERHQRYSEKSKRNRRRLTIIFLLLPGLLWLALFFVLPIVTLAMMSVSTGNVGQGWSVVGDLSSYQQAFSGYLPEFLHSLEFGVASTVLALLIAYPAAYWIAFYGGEKKTAYILVVLLPFYVSSLIRTISWQFVLADNGVIFGPLRRLGLLPSNFHVLATPVAVVGGLTYAQLPFMMLPIFAALERVDPGFLEASRDLYASRWETVRRIVIPLSMPGIFAGVLLTFISATGDYVNEILLGGTGTGVVGAVIRSQFLVNLDYPLASAISLVLMVALLIVVLAYSKALGTDDLMGGAAV